VPKYDAAFFRYVNSGAIRSAERLIPLLLGELPVKHVLDVGCGQGAWLSVWHRFGVQIVGLDGSYVNRDHLLIPTDAFLAKDLSEPFELGRRFDLVQSLEVAEHLPESRAAQFVASLVRHADVVLFSAAPKGQGGDYHINEQPYEYWRALFAKHDYVAFDCIRPMLALDSSVEPWYRYNSILYVSRGKAEQLPVRIRGSRVPDEEKLRDFSPLPYRIRKALTTLLPTSVVTAIAKMKERAVAAIRNRPRNQAL
jgi:SAM-dependent methyltransferase